MIGRYQVLARRIETEIQPLDRTVSAIQRHWTSAQRTRADQDAYLNSVALNLHSFYSGLERLFELIAVELDGGTLGGEAWHSELLRQVALEVPGIRAAVLQAATAERLDEYRKFRHRIRNIYAANLDPQRMEHLVDNLPALWSQVQVDLMTFTEFLNALAHADRD